MAEDKLVSQLKLPTPPNPLSKNAQKKQLKKERLAIAKAEKKLAKKQAKRQRVEQASPQVTATTTHPAESHPAKRRKLTQKSDTSSSAIVVIDLGFDELMLEKVSSTNPSPVFT
jgi:tRNA (guanine9-N1)-methyltransferase